MLPEFGVLPSQKKGQPDWDWIGLREHETLFDGIDFPLNQSNEIGINPIK